MTEKANQPRSLPRLLLRILSSLIGIALMAAAALSLVLARPPQADTPAAVPQPLLTASPAVTASRETEIPALIASFPAPVMCFMSGSGMAFISGTSADTSLDDGFGRIVTLRWKASSDTSSSETIILESIYPASALRLLQSGNYHFSQIAGPALFGSASVRMENSETIRIHATTDSGLYVITLPKSLSGELSSLVRSLQLFTLQQETV